MEVDRIMSNNPINLAFRFILELAALAAIGIWGWYQGEGISRILFAIGAPVLMAIIWGTFRVPNDASASGKAPIPIPGILRLVIELSLFSFAVWGLFQTGKETLGWILGILVVIHYLISYDRCIWLITGK
jgi:hypothetical protein